MSDGAPVPDDIRHKLPEGGSDMSLTACAQIVERGDPDRFLATMAAPPVARERLFPLYAFNVEVARAPWASEEPMIADMRLQWWRDVIEEITEGRPVRRHEVATPLAEVIRREQGAQLDTLIAARRWDIYKDPFEDQVDFDRYIDQTTGTLLTVAAQLLGSVDERVTRDLGYAQGVANWLRAIPELEARKRIPLVDGSVAGVQSLAKNALHRLETARKNRAMVSKDVRPALLAAWEAGAILRQAASDPARVAAGALGQSPARKRLSLIARSSTGIW